MSRYFFHLDYGQLERDEVGTELPSLEAARASAVQLVGEILRDTGDKFWTAPDLTLRVTDAADLTLWTMAVTGYASASVSGLNFNPRGAVPASRDGRS